MGPGQITDDSEMAMCLLQGLRDSRTLDLDNIQAFLGQWFQSKPFDIGITTKKALKVIDLQTLNPVVSFKATESECKSSLSNGCLMRVTPLAVWGRKLKKEDLYEAV